MFGASLARLFRAHILAKELFSEFLQCAVGAQFFHRRADFGKRFVVALVGDKSGADFFRRVRQTYLARAAASPERYAVVDSSRSKNTVRTEIEALLDKIFEQ